MFDWKSLVRTIAPALGTALGSPLAGVATKYLADKFLGNGDATDEQISDAIQCATPEQLAKLKEIDANFNIEMKKLDIDLYTIDAQDRAGARAREAAIKDRTPSILAYVITIGFFATLWKILADGVVDQADQIVLTIMSNLLMMALTYYYGSSNKDNKK